MPFSEATKLEVKQKAHFCCVVCHQPFVEVHHIIPQAAEGTDDLDNAAPLCALCHDHFGGNPDKRKQIREMRDLWYELCETRFRDSPALQLAEAIEDVKGGQEQQASLLNSIKHLLESFYTHQSEKISTAVTVEQISSLTGVTIPSDFSASRDRETRKRAFLGFMEQWRSEVERRFSPQELSGHHADKVHPFRAEVGKIRNDFTDIDGFNRLVQKMSSLTKQQIEGGQPTARDMLAGIIDEIIWFTNKSS